MIHYTQGNLLEAKAEALVNTVNEVGVMGKGIALMFRESFPDNTKAYEAACKARDVHVGSMFVTREKDLVDDKWIINFPTKKHWRFPSKMEWIRAGLKDLVRVVRENGIRSIALPPLGCGNGGLQWSQVKREIEAAFSELKDIEVIVFTPTDVYQNAPKRVGVRELTPARALIAELVRRYSILGLECTNLEVQKLAWFFLRMLQFYTVRDPLKLQFTADKYGPYADNLRHLLDGLDGSYLHCEKRLSDAGPMDLIWFEPSEKCALENYLKGDECKEFAVPLDATTKVIDGFESPLGMELLATVDWLLVNEGCKPDRDSIKAGLQAWPAGKSAGRRKLKLFSDRLIDLGLARLASINRPSAS